MNDGIQTEREVRDRPVHRMNHTPLRLMLGTNNVWALPDSAGLTLIDAGPDYAGAWDEVGRWLQSHDWSIGTVHTVVLTHAHPDHAGLARRWQQQGARVLAGRADAALLAMREEQREAERAHGRTELTRHGVHPDHLRATAATPQRYTRWPAALQMTACHADELLDDGVQLECGGSRLRVVACPGHTPGSIVLLDDHAGAAFTGDHVLPRMAPTSGIQFRNGQRRPSLPLYLASLLALADAVVSRAAPGTTEVRGSAAAVLRLGAAMSDETVTPDRGVPAPSATPPAHRSDVSDAAVEHAPFNVPPLTVPWTDSLQLRDARGETPDDRPTQRTGFIAYPGHGEPTDLLQAITWTVRLLEQRARRTLTHLRHGPATAFTLAMRLFPHAASTQLRPLIAETIGLLDLLAERGLAAAVTNSEPVLWHTTEEAGWGNP